MRRLLVTGGSGYLGRRVALSAAAQGWQVISTYLTNPPSTGEPLQLDVLDDAAVRAALDDLKPTAIIHTACSNRAGANIAAIAPAARIMAQAAHAQDVRLVHVSTDMVFDGEHAPYADDAALGPLADYGMAKAEAEAIVQAVCPAAAIGRPSLIWSLDPLDRQTGWLVEGMRNGERVTLFTDEVRCPVYVDDLAATLLALAERPEVAGPLNLGGAQALNRWEFGLKLLKALGLARASNVVPGVVADSVLRRPRDLTLYTERVRRHHLPPLRGVDAVLAQVYPPRQHQPRMCEG